MTHQLELWQLQVFDAGRWSYISSCRTRTDVLPERSPRVGACSRWTVLRNTCYGHYRLPFDQHPRSRTWGFENHFSNASTIGLASRMGGKESSEDESCLMGDCRLLLLFWPANLGQKGKLKGCLLPGRRRSGTFKRMEERKGAITLE
jgi:hypothetical protein